MSFVKEDYLLFDLLTNVNFHIDKVFKTFLHPIIYSQFRLVGISAENSENSHCVLNGTYGVVARDGHCNSQEKQDKVKLDGTSITRLSKLDYSLSSNED